MHMIKTMMVLTLDGLLFVGLGVVLVQWLIG